MTTYNKATLKTFFEQLDVPQGSDYANLIDSQVNIVETALQSMAGPLQATELVASRVSAGNGNFTGTLTVTGQMSAKGNLAVNSLGVSALSITGNTSANVIYSQPGTYSAPVTITASGTAIGTANKLTTSRMTILTAATDGSATGIALLSNQTGLQQYLYNDTAVSANLWPCVGGQINNLASGAAFGVTAKTLYTIIHTKASGYAVK